MPGSARATVLGPVTLERAYYCCPHCHAGFCPRDGARAGDAGTGLLLLSALPCRVLPARPGAGAGRRKPVPGRAADGGIGGGRGELRGGGRAVARPCGRGRGRQAGGAGRRGAGRGDRRRRTADGVGASAVGADDASGNGRHRHSGAAVGGGRAGGQAAGRLGEDPRGQAGRRLDSRRDGRTGRPATGRGIGQLLRRHRERRQPRHRPDAVGVRRAGRARGPAPRLRLRGASCWATARAGSGRSPTRCSPALCR